MHNTLRHYPIVLGLLSFVGFSIASTLAPAQATPPSAPAPTTKPARTVGKPECIRTIDLKDFGSIQARYGDLDGDGTPEAVFAQITKAPGTNSAQFITCVTAINLEGKILWQRGTPNTANRNSDSDCACQIYDFDNDGNNEVLVVEGLTFRMLDGKTGKVKREAPVPANDCLLIANFAGAKHPNDLVTKDRYGHVYALDKDLKPLWDARIATGHYPMNYDFNGDGKDELLCGYACFAPDGKKLWEVTSPEHNDGVDIDVLDSSGIASIAIAGTAEGLLISPDGQVIWRKTLRHVQHAVIGAFVEGRKDKQVVMVERINSGSPQGGIATCYTKDGTALWSTGANGGITIASTVDGWTGEKGRSYLCLFRRSAGNPVLIDGTGAIVTTFDPPNGGNARNAYCQHFDALGDSREEMFIHNPSTLWVFANAAPAPADLPAPDRVQNRRMYGATFYVGQQ